MTLYSTGRLKCFCGRIYSKSLDLEEHRRARGHFPSHVCKGACQHPPVGQYDVQIRKCDSCGKVCERLDILEDHRIATGHCFCSECDLSFDSQSAFNMHRQTEAHASEFRCCNCDISFKDIHALNAHMASRAHRKPLKEEPQKKKSKAKGAITTIVYDRECEKCQRTFNSHEALQQHLESVRHKPLSSLDCPVGKGCRGKFSAPSALLHHLESGNCRSGMDRDDIYHMVQLFDKDRVIHNLPTLTPATSVSGSSCNPSPQFGPSRTSSDISNEWSLVSATLSHGSVDGSWVDLLALGDSLLSIEGSALDNTAVERSLQCPLCPKARKKFATAEALRQHINSPAHGAKLYHCPTNMLPDGRGGTGKKGRQFTTLGGLAQHLEQGACYGGKKTFLYCIDLIQRQLEQLGFGGMRLLLPIFQS